MKTRLHQAAACAALGAALALALPAAYGQPSGKPAAPAAKPAAAAPAAKAAPGTKFEDFRTHNVKGCIAAYAGGGIPQGKALAFCNCVMDGVVAGLSPQEIKAVDEARRTGGKAPEIDAKIDKLLPQASVQCQGKLK
jgi:hypothetical protein